MKKKGKKIMKWQIVTAITLIIIITASTIGIQLAQVKLSADDYENRLQNQAAEYLTDANDYVSQGMFDRALEKINLYFNLLPDTEEGFLMRASIYTGNKEYEKAIGDMTNAITCNAKEPDYYLQRGCLYILLNDYDKAAADFNQVISLDATDPYALLLIAQIYYEKEQYQKALDTYDIYLEQNEPSADILAQEAYIYSLMNNNKQATAMLKKAYDIAPNAEYATALAQSYAALKDYENAVRFSSISLSEDASNLTIIKLRADSYYLLEKYENALKDYTTYLEKEPKDETCSYQQCICFLQLERYDELKEAAANLLTFAADKDIIKNTQDILDYLNQQ